MKKKSWHLNIKHGHYFTQIPADIEAETVNFGIKDSNGAVVELGEIQMNYHQLNMKKRIRILNKKYQVNIYFEQPEFFVCSEKGDKNRHVLEVKYPSSSWDSK